MSTPGYVYLIGAGPWDPGLLTVRGRELLERVDAIIYDYLVNPELLNHARDDAERIAVGGPGDRMPQVAINARLVELSSAGKVVARLKGGDPFVFSRGGDEARALAEAGIAFEVVPGVTAAVAGAAYAGIPITHRGDASTVAFCTGHERAGKPASDIDWVAVAKMGTVVFYMGARNLDRIATRLIEAGRSPETPVALVRWATRPNQATVVTTLGQCAAASDAVQVEPPMTAIVGSVVRQREHIAWFESRPLHGLSVIATRSLGQQGPLADRLRELGADVVPLPTISFAAAADGARIEAAIEALGTYDWVIFTSANGVDFFLDALYASGRDPRSFAATRIACIGPATSLRLRARGLVADRVPKAFVAEALIETMTAEGVEGRRVLIPRAKVAREILPDQLRAAGALVDVVPVYETISPEVDADVFARVRHGDVDLITFTASSTVDHFCELFERDGEAGVRALEAVKRRVQAVCIGPVTAQTASARGFDVVVVAETFTIPGLVDALVGWRRGSSKP